MSSTGLDTRVVYVSMIRDLKKRIYDNNVSVGKRRMKLENMQLADRMSTNLAINIDIKNAKMLSELSNLLSNLNAYGKVGVQIPATLKRNIEDLCPMLSDKEVQQFKNIFEDCVKHTKDSHSRFIKSDLNRMKKLISNLGLDNKTIYLNTYVNDYEIVDYKTAITQLETNFRSQDRPNINYNKKPKGTYIPSAEERLLFDTLNLRNNGQLLMDKNVKLISDNLFDIRNAFITRTKMVKLIQKIMSVITALDEVSDFEVSQAKSYLLRLEAKYSKELAKVEKYLGKFDFTSVKAQIESRKEEEKLANATKYKMLVYEGMAFELEKMKNEAPEDKERIHDLNVQMASFAIKSGLTGYQLESAHDNGIRRYNLSVALVEEAKDGGKKLYNEYQEYCRNSKEKEKLTFAEYVRIYHDVDALDSVIDPEVALRVRK